jgi:hypothetical protein
MRAAKLRGLVRASTRFGASRTDEARHAPPRTVRTPRASSAEAGALHVADDGHDVGGELVGERLAPVPRDKG